MKPVGFADPTQASAGGRAARRAASAARGVKRWSTPLCAASTLLAASAACATPAQAPADAASAASIERSIDAEQWYHWTDDGVRHHVTEFGRAAAAGDTVIVLHGGWGAEHSYLVPAVDPLTDRYRFVLYDQRGSLRSPAPDSTIRLDRLVADLEQLREAVGIERVTLVAHSMGNALAYAYLAQHPGRVRGLVLVGAVHPARFTGGPNMDFIREIWPEADSAALVKAGQDFFDDALSRALALWQHEGLIPDSLRGVPAQELDLMRVLEGRERTRAWRIRFTSVNTCGGENWRDMLGGMAFYNQLAANAILSDTTYASRSARFWPALQSYQSPVRVIIGTCDYVDIGPAAWPRIVERLPDGGLTVVEGAGHSLWMDRPDEFSAALAAALVDATR